MDVNSKLYDFYERIRAYNEDISHYVEMELKRINRPFLASDMGKEPYVLSQDNIFKSLYLNQRGTVMVENQKSREAQSKSADLDFPLFILLQKDDVPLAKLLPMLVRLQKIPSAPLQRYHLRGKQGNADLHVRISDLMPLKTKDQHSYAELQKLLIYTDYEPDWSKPMEEELEILLSRYSDPKIDFFYIHGTDVVVLPGTYLFTTRLKCSDELFE